MNGADKKTKTKPPGVKKRRRTSAPAAPVPPPRRRSRRRNPGSDVRGTMMAAGAGAAFALVGQMVTHVTSRSITNRPARLAVRVAVPALMGIGGGIMLSKVSPTAGKACAAVGAGLSMLHGVSEFTVGGAAPKVMLQRLGYGQLGSPDNIVMRDGQLLRVFDDGREELLQGLQGEPVQLLLEDNTYAPGVQLGSLEDDSIIVRDEGGNIHVIAPERGMSGIEQAEQLNGDEDPAGGFEQAEQLGSSEEDAQY